MNFVTNFHDSERFIAWHLVRNKKTRAGWRNIHFIFLCAIPYKQMLNAERNEVV